MRGEERGGGEDVEGANLEEKKEEHTRACVNARARNACKCRHAFCAGAAVCGACTFVCEQRKKASETPKDLTHTHTHNKAKLTSNCNLQSTRRERERARKMVVVAGKKRLLETKVKKM